MDALRFSETSITTNRVGVTCQKTRILIFICYYYRSAMHLKFTNFWKEFFTAFMWFCAAFWWQDLNVQLPHVSLLFAAIPISLQTVDTVSDFLSVEFLFSPQKLIQVGQIRSWPVPLNSSFYAYWCFSYSLSYMKKYHYNWLYVRYFYVFLHIQMMASNKGRNTRNKMV